MANVFLLLPSNLDMMLWLNQVGLVQDLSEQLLEEDVCEGERDAGRRSEAGMKEMTEECHKSAECCNLNMK